MVRVISVYNFPKQNVTGVDEVFCAAASHSDKLLLAQKNHAISVRDQSLKEIISFPTVDQVRSVHYSHKGNYIATLEGRGDVRFVRIYLEWESADISSPLRARIAGRVTPLSQYSHGVEMLEVPTPAMPDCLAVCAISGNIVVGCGERLCVYKYTTQVHDISRIKYVDFMKTNWNIELDFSPENIFFSEDVIAVHNDQYLQVVRILPSHRQNAKTGAEGSDVFLKCCNYDKLVVNGVISTHEFPSVNAEPQFRHTPFHTFPQQPIKVVYDSPSRANVADNCIEAAHVMRLALPLCLVGTNSRRDIPDTFTCLCLKPYYSHVEPQNFDTKSKPMVRPLGSEFYNTLYAFTIFFGTQQEGYLYHYQLATKKCALVSIYPLTAPLQDAVLEDSLLHALTEAGLETYTLRPPNATSSVVISEQIDNDDPICLLCLRPFVHIRKLLLGESSLYLLASEGSDGGTTLYQLTLADASTLWADFLAVAEENQWQAPATYSHLLREANLIMRTRCESLRRFPSGSWMNKLSSVLEQVRVLNDNVYQQSCLILADFYILHNSFKAASHLYRESGCRLPEVVKRIRGLYDLIPQQYKSSFSEKDIMKGLVFHVMACLQEENKSFLLYTGNREEFYSHDVGALVTCVLDVLEKQTPEVMSEVIISSPVVQHFSSDRALSFLHSIQDPLPIDTLALALVCLQRGQHDRGQSLLTSLDLEPQNQLLLKNGHILFEQSEMLSELGLVLLNVKPQFFAELLSTLVIKENTIKLETFQKIMLQLLQTGGSLSKNAAEVLQVVVETKLEEWIKNEDLYNAGAKEGCNTLIWMYLTQLSQRKVPILQNEVKFKDLRPKFLDQLPPFGPEFAQVLSPQHSPTLSASVNPTNTLYKLQGLLATHLARDFLYRVRVFIAKTPKVFGSLSIQIQCADPAEAVQLLLNFAPQALLAYLKETHLEASTWHSLIEQIQNKTGANQNETKRKFYYEHLLSTGELFPLFKHRQKAAESLGVLSPILAFCMREHVPFVTSLGDCSRKLALKWTLNLTEIVEHMAQILPVEDVALLVPTEALRNKCLRIAHGNEQAKQVRALIMMTGNQLR